MNIILNRNAHSTARRFRQIAGGFFAVLLPMLCTAIGEAASFQNATITFVHRARSFKPGEVILLKARSSHPLKSMQVEMFEREFPAFGDEGGLTWTSLIGIDLETRPGRYEIELKGVGMKGNSVVSRKVVGVTARIFPTRKLAVDERYVTPPADALIRTEEESKRVNAIFDSVTPEKFWRGSFLIPVPGKVISAFGKRNVYNGQPRSPHTGVDFRGSVGTSIRSPNAGRVVLAANLYYSGNTIIVDHGLGLYSYLGHMSKFSVKEGDRVEAGDIIGKVGATGRATGPHLHWTVRLMTTRVDPLSLVSILGSSNRSKVRP
jgi:murein DD-endopeptidase MepM/ murein hydrolase activator NlpD